MLVIIKKRLRAILRIKCGLQAQGYRVLIEKEGKNYKITAIK